ncbi:hypothetical protein, partial [Hyphomonas sp.]|uniref:hypothetical protein n=1 Tax=Hyphomonas sp. TaxID=87 RepID=UPI000C9104DE
MAISRMNMERQLRNMGGLMTLEEPRQGYFLGKIVRKAKKAVKKVVKSPVGKLAILGGLGAYAGGLGPFAGLKGAGFAKPFFAGIKTGFMNPLMQGPMATRSGGFGRTIGQFIRNKPGTAALLGLGATAVAAPFFMGGDEEEVDEGVDVSGIQPMVADIRNQARQFYRDPAAAASSGLFFMPQRRFVQDSFLAAEGGLADIPREGYDQGKLVLGEGFKSETLKRMAMDMFGKPLRELNADEMEMLREEFNISKGITDAKEGGIMDLGGMEKDYREGGFVPIGAEERADDVPARLSKNEFVFTADAVRNAGGGDID